MFGDMGKQNQEKTQLRVLTGDRPTGRSHLGHWVGSFKNRLRLQDEYDCFFLVADLHALTTHYRHPDSVKLNIRELVLDYLGVGIDPRKSVIYLQSMIPEVAELFTLFSMLVSVPRLQRIPVLKDTLQALRLSSPSLGLLGYPVLQAADILMVQADLVPVGEDQASHVEMTREIARRFNRLYDTSFPVPEVMVGDVPTLPGIDGQAKMSKSLNNAIFLADDRATVIAKVKRMFTDPTRIHPTDPGHVEGNPVFIYHDAFNDDVDEVKSLKERYRAGKVGDVEVKERLAGALNRFLDPIRQRRGDFAGQKGVVEDILHEGTAAARREAQGTLEMVKLAMGLDAIP